MRLPVAAALLPLLAMPAAAQQNTTVEGGCTVHGRSELRCAVTMPMVGRYGVNIELLTNGPGTARGSAQAWLSECGLPGSAGAMVSVTNSSGTTALRRSTADAFSVVCAEVFILNCQSISTATPVACNDGFGGRTRIRVRLQS
jgi:hypothetical protein